MWFGVGLGSRIHKAHSPHIHPHHFLLFPLLFTSLILTLRHFSFPPRLCLLSFAGGGGRWGLGDGKEGMRNGEEKNGNP